MIPRPAPPEKGEFLLRDSGVALTCEGSSPKIGALPDGDFGKIVKKHQLTLGKIAPAAGLVLAFALSAGQDPTGPMTRDEILKARPAWAAVMETYRPRPDVLERIRNFARPLAVEIFFGLDSADSRNLVSQFLRLQELLDPAFIKAAFIAVSPDLKDPSADIQASLVESVPTLIVRVDDRELGRIVGPPLGSLEEGIEAVLTALVDVEGIDLNDRESLRGVKHDTWPIPCWPCHLASRLKISLLDPVRPVRPRHIFP